MVIQALASDTMTRLPTPAKQDTNLDNKLQVHAQFGYWYLYFCLHCVSQSASEATMSNSSAQKAITNNARLPDHLF